MKTFKLHLIRHGLTDANFKGIYAGSGTDLPLSEEGTRQLKQLREDFSYPQVPLVFVSPLLRARQTADLAGKGADGVLRRVHGHADDVDALLPVGDAHAADDVLVIGVQKGVDLAGAFGIVEDDAHDRHSGLHGCSLPIQKTPGPKCRERITTQTA